MSRLVRFLRPFHRSAVNVWDVNHWVGQQMCAMFAEKIDAAGAGKLLDDEGKGVWEL